MKTIIYVLIAVMFFGSIFTGYAYKSNSKRIILIQSIDGKMTADMLTQSAQIISGRLKDLSSEKFDIILIPEKNQIQIELTDDWDIKTVENLILQKGRLEFYETYNDEGLTELLKGNKYLFSLFNQHGSGNSFGDIGCIPIADVEKVNDYLHTLDVNQFCKFVWSSSSDHHVCLFALRSSGEKGPLMTRADIKSMECLPDENSDAYYLEIKFIDSSVTKWSDATKRNINQEIAIVMDDTVISAPVVREVINNGSCQITGNFTSAEARYLVAMGINGELPVIFKLVQ